MSRWKEKIKKISLLDYTFILFFLLVFLVVGVMFEEGASASRIVAFKGIFFDAADDWPLTQIFISTIYGFLYKVWKSVPWYGIIDYSLVAFSLVFYFKLFKKSGVLYLFVLFLALMVDDMVLFSFTRTAMLVVGASLLFSFYSVRKYQKNRISKRKLSFVLLGLNVLILLGFFNRPQAFAYLFALFSLFMICYFVILKVNWRQLKKWFSLTIPVWICLIFSVIYYFKQPAIVKESQKLAPYFYNIYGGSFHDSFKNISKKDSLTLLLIKGNFVNDRKTMDLAFAARVTKDSPKSYFSAEKFIDFQLLSKNTWKFTPFYLKHHFTDILCMLALAIFLFIAWLRTKNRKALLILVYMILCMLSLFAITNIVKMEQRIASPAFLFTFVSVLLLIRFAGINMTVNKIPKGIIWIFSFALLMINCTLLSERTTKYRALVDSNLQFQKNLDTYYQHHTLVLSNPVLGVLYRNPFSEFSYDGSNASKFYEAEAIIYMPSMRKMIYDYAGSLEFEAFFDKMFEEKDKTIYIATEDWKNLIVAYMEEVYGKRYVFQEERKALGNLSAQHDKMMIFRPEKVIVMDNPFPN